MNKFLLEMLLGYLAKNCKKGPISKGYYKDPKPFDGGGQAQVFIVSDRRNHYYAMKVFESAKDAQSENSILASLKKANPTNSSFPTVYYCGRDRFTSKYVLVMSLMGLNLRNIIKHGQKRQGLGTIEILLVAKQLVEMIQQVHNAGFIHRDIKPENIVSKRGKNIEELCLIDFGLATTYVDRLGKHKKSKFIDSFVGTDFYASANAMKGWRQSRRDDIISIVYTLVQLRNGLPWNRDPEPYPEELIFEKRQTPTEDLCREMPPSIRRLANEAFSLEYDETPKYEKYLDEIGNDLKIYEDMLFSNDNFICDENGKAQ